MGELYDLGVRVFTDDGDCVADARRDAAARSSTRPRCRARCSRSTPRIPALVARRPHARRRVVGAARHPGPARRGRVVDRRPRPRARRAHRRPLPRAARVDRGRRSSSCARRRPTGVRVTAECTPQHLVLTDEACAALRPGLQDEPAAARATPTSTRCAPGSPTARSTRSRPTTRRTRPRPRSARSRRRRPGCSGSRPRSRSCSRRSSSRACSRSPTRSARCRGDPARVAGLDAHGHGGPVAPGEPANLCVIDPAAAVGRSTPTRLASQAAQLALGGLEAHRQGPPHLLRGAPTVRRRRAHPMSPLRVDSPVERRAAPERHRR